MIRTAAILSALVLAGCAGRGDAPTPVVDPIAVNADIYAALPEELSAGLLEAEGRFNRLTDAQIDRLMFSLLQQNNCNLSANPAIRTVQYSVFGFGAYRSVQLPVADYEAWADEADENDALWDAQKNSMGRQVQRRAGRSGTEDAFFADGPGGLVTGLTSCGGIDGL